MPNSKIKLIVYPDVGTPVTFLNVMKIFQKIKKCIFLTTLYNFSEELRSSRPESRTDYAETEDETDRRSDDADTTTSSSKVDRKIKKTKKIKNKNIFIDRQIAISTL